MALSSSTGQESQPLKGNERARCALDIWAAQVKHGLAVAYEEWKAEETDALREFERQTELALKYPNPKHPLHVAMPEPARLAEMDTYSRFRTGNTIIATGDIAALTNYAIRHSKRGVTTPEREPATSTDPFQSGSLHPSRMVSVIVEMQIGEHPEVDCTVDVLKRLCLYLHPRFGAYQVPRFVNARNFRDSAWESETLAMKPPDMLKADYFESLLSGAYQDLLNRVFMAVDRRSQKV